ncbi:MAG: aldehyde dehydrogenase family protein [Elusimicrobiota bacterium]|nr:MAG: aldehyde dehydrogenase family protein [Elusimicrobiota bacterium]
MPAASPASSKITYTAATADMAAFHKAYDAAVAAARANAGKTYAMRIDGKAVAGKALTDKLSPIDGRLLSRFPSASPAELDAAVKGAKRAQKGWGALAWRERLRILRRAAALIRERKYEIAAIVSLEVGKNRMEAMGDTEEAADLIDYYAKQIEDNDGYSKPLGKLLPNENTRSVLRPYGVFACIAPFNFPISLSAGMGGAALLGGNAVVYKPSLECPLTGLMLWECLKDAGLPDGVFQFVTGDGPKVGEALWRHPLVDGVVFTGSREVGLKVLKEFPTRYAKPVLMELGGKNPTYVAETANLDEASDGVMKSAFGLQGQKCSACSRVYVHEKVYDAFVKQLVSKTEKLVVGDPVKQEVYMGPVIHERSVKTYLGAVASAKKGGRILTGGKRLPGKGHFVAPTIAELPLDHELFFRELFVPFLAVGKVKSLEAAIAESNKADYGLTAGIFTAKREEIEKYFDEMETGVVYANRKTGATTGAWPGVQAFCGWKGSGSTGKGGCGPYYAAQFMREQSRTIME